MIRRIIQIDEEKCNGCGACAEACHEGAMYYCFLSGAPAGGTERTVYMILDGIFCISAWVAGVGILWYVRWLRRRNKELGNMIKILLKNADKLDK